MLMVTASWQQARKLAALADLIDLWFEDIDDLGAPILAYGNLLAIPDLADVANAGSSGYWFVYDNFATFLGETYREAKATVQSEDFQADFQAVV